MRCWSRKNRAWKCRIKLIIDAKLPYFMWILRCICRGYLCHYLAWVESHHIFSSKFTGLNLHDHMSCSPDGCGSMVMTRHLAIHPTIFTIVALFGDTSKSRHTWKSCTIKGDSITMHNCYELRDSSVDIYLLKSRTWLQEGRRKIHHVLYSSSGHFHSTPLQAQR